MLMAVPGLSPLLSEREKLKRSVPSVNPIGLTVLNARPDYTTGASSALDSRFSIKVVGAGLLSKF